MKIAVVGIGKMGTDYVRLVQVGGNSVVGIDIDPVKVEAAKKNFPEMVFSPHPESIEDFDFDGAIVATNTPSHHKVLIDLMRRGVRYILCEKPIGLHMAAVKEVEAVMKETGSKIYTGLLMNFSPATLHVITMMQAANLVMTEGSFVWGKNRMPDKRPTPGDLEDETVHGVGILHALASVNQAIQQILVSAHLTYPVYASAEAQAKAHEFDPSFPMEVNATTMGTELIRTNLGDVPCSLHSSFILGSQVRRVTAVLAKASDPTELVFSVEFNFDVNKADQVRITALTTNDVVVKDFPCDKLGDQTKAFLHAVFNGTEDPRLTDFTGAKQAVAMTEAILLSHKLGGIQQLAYVAAA